MTRPVHFNECQSNHFVAFHTIFIKHELSYCISFQRTRILKIELNTIQVDELSSILSNGFVVQWFR